MPNALIPKVIHYCWFGPKPFSRTVRKCIATWHKHLSDYEFQLWNEESCATYAAANGLSNPMEHPFVKSAYAAKKYAFVADYVRFWALYHWGGVYLDTDMYVVRNFDDLLDTVFFAGWETAKHDMVSCGIIGSIKYGACIQDILSMYDSIIFSENQICNFIVPRLITPLVIQHKESRIYSYDYFYAFPWGERDKKNPEKFVTENTHALHLWDISWEPWYKKIIRQIVIEIKKIIYA